MEETRWLLRQWQRRARESQWGHYAAERALLRVHYWIGIPLVVLTTFSGTSVFATLSNNPDTWFKILVGVTAVVAAILGGLQTFLRSTDRAAAHRLAATKAAALRRLLEQHLAAGLTGANPVPLLDDVRTRLNELAEGSPPIPQRVWNRTERTLEARNAAARGAIADNGKGAARPDDPAADLVSNPRGESQ